MSELQRLKSLLPPENESWVFIEAAAAIDPPLITLEEIGRDEVEIQIDLDEWDNFAIDHRNLFFMSELQRLKSLLPPENESWVFVEAAAAIDPPLITLEEIGRDEVEIQIDLEKWDNLAIDHRNLLFWHEVGKIQNDTIPRDGWEMAALAIGLGGAIGELWVQDGLLLLLALGLSSFAGYRLYIKNNSEKKLQDAIFADERAIDLACRFGYSIPNAYKSLGGALKELIEKTRKKKKRSFFEDRLEALRKSAEKARSELSQQEGSEKSVSSENVYGQ